MGTVPRSKAASFRGAGGTTPPRRPPRSVGVHVDDSLRERLGCLLRDVVPDPARDRPMLVLPRELRRVRAGVGMWSAVGVALQRDRGHRDGGRLGKLLLELVVAALPAGETQPPAIVV